MEFLNLLIIHGQFLDPWRFVLIVVLIFLCFLVFRLPRIITALKGKRCD